MRASDAVFGASGDRWDKARRRSQGLADKGLGPALLIYYTVYFPIGFLVLMTLGALVATLAFGDEVGWPESLGGGFIFAGLGALVGGLIYNSKKVVPAAEYGQLSVVMSLHDDERKHIRRQVLGKELVVPEHAGVARGFAVQTRKALATQILFLPMLPLILTPQALRPDGFIWWLTALAYGLQILASIVAVRQFSLAGRFLESTGPLVASSD